MLTTTCTICRDGRCATARVSTVSPQQKGEVRYDGETNLFPDRFARLANADLHQWARNLASGPGITVRVEDEGEYERWAQ